MLAFHTAPARLGAGTLPAPALRQPPAARVAAAAIVSVAGSLAADAALVTIATAVFPSTRGYGHFPVPRLRQIDGNRRGDRLPGVASRDSDLGSAPLAVLPLAILVTLVLWLPGPYILVSGQPAEPVAVLMIMHLAMALTTCNCLVQPAKVGVS